MPNHFRPPGTHVFEFSDKPHLYSAFHPLPISLPTPTPCLCFTYARQPRLMRTARVSTRVGVSEYAVQFDLANYAQTAIYHGIPQILVITGKDTKLNLCRYIKLCPAKPVIHVWDDLHLCRDICSKFYALTAMS